MAVKLLSFLSSRLAWVSQHRAVILRTGMILLFLGVAAALYPSGQSSQYAGYHIGMVSDREIIAPFDFEIDKSRGELERERLEARMSVDPCVFINDRVTDQQLTETSRFFQRFRDAAPHFQDSANGGAAADSLHSVFLADYGINVREARWAFLLSGSPESLRMYEDRLVSILRNILSVGVLDQPQMFYGIGTPLRVQRGDFTEQMMVEDFYDVDAAMDRISERLRDQYTTQSDTVNVGYEILVKFLNANVVYDEERTDKLRSAAVAQVPLARGFVLEGQRVVDDHEVVTEDIYNKIQSLRASISYRTQRESQLGNLGPFLGKVLFTALLLGAFLLYLSVFRPRYFYHNGKLLLILLILISQYFSAWLIYQQFDLELYWPAYLVPAPIAAMLLTIIFDIGVGAVGTAVIAVGLGSVFGLEFSVMAYALFGGLVAAYSVRRVRQRSQFFLATVYLLATVCVSIIAIESLRFTPWPTIFTIILKAGLPLSIATPMIVWGVLYLFEVLFRISTDITLLELSDLNKPLLRRLQIEAPGTYHHSMMVGTLAERAADSIGANALLVRVAAYYHDIGKMVKPEYFSENQQQGANPHEDLQPRMSSLVIAAHVREGIDLARQHKLPEEIIDFIPQHHGTNRISFFYERALREVDAKYLNEEDFRYPGPKPQTRETGIMMLADGVEASTRALPNPTPGKLRETVRMIVEARFRDGELDHCDLTMRDLTAISESFMSTLTSVYHPRVVYPERDEPSRAAPREKKPDVVDPHN